MQITIISAGNMARGIPTCALAAATPCRSSTAPRTTRPGARSAVAPAVSWEGPYGTQAAAISRTWPCHEGNRRWFVPYDFAGPYGADRSAPPMLGGHRGEPPELAVLSRRSRVRDRVAAYALTGGVDRHRRGSGSRSALHAHLPGPVAVPSRDRQAARRSWAGLVHLAGVGAREPGTAPGALMLASRRRRSSDSLPGWA